MVPADNYQGEQGVTPVTSLDGCSHVTVIPSAVETPSADECEVSHRDDPP